MRTLMHGLAAISGSVLTSFLGCMALACAVSFSANATISGGGGDTATGPIDQKDGVTEQPSAVESTIDAVQDKTLTDGLVMQGQFTYVLQNGVSSITLDRINNDSFSRTTGTLQLSLWATTYQPARGAGITGRRLATYSPLTALAPRTFYGSISRSASYARPPDGSYWLVLVLGEFNPSACPSNPDGYCLTDSAISFTQVSFGNALPSFNYSDLWWTSTESGWGISLLHHPSNIVFGAWFTYDDTGRPKWYVAPYCPLVGDYCFGTLYETTGSPFSQPFNPSAVTVTPVGTLSLSFNSFGNGVMTYNVRGVTSTKAISRQPF